MTHDIEREIQLLHNRLAEAEEMRRAIVRAEVDGFVVGEGDGDRYVHLLSGAYEREAAERRRRHQVSDEHTRRFLSLLAVELINMVKSIRASLELLQRHSLPEECRGAHTALASQASTLQRLAEDLRAVNPKD